MKQYLLDTTPLSAFIVGRPRARDLIEPWVERDEAATSVLVYGEVVEYLRGMANAQQRFLELRDVLRDITPRFLSLAILERYADLRRQLRPPYGPGLIGDIDTLIAATALEHGLTVVTTDSDFRRVPGLSVMQVTVR